MSSMRSMTNEMGNTMQFASSMLITSHVSCQKKYVSILGKLTEYEIRNGVTNLLQSALALWSTHISVTRYLTQPNFCTIWNGMQWICISIVKGVLWYWLRIACKLKENKSFPSGTRCGCGFYRIYDVSVRYPKKQTPASSTTAHVHHVCSFIHFYICSDTHGIVP